MRKLLIAVKSETLAAALTEDLQNRYCIYSCSTGPNALSLIEAVHPDALILYLSLPDMDGLTVLQKAKYKPPIILAITNLMNEAVMQTAVNLGIKGVAIIPCTIKCITDGLARIEKLPTQED